MTSLSSCSRVGEAPPLLVRSPPNARRGQRRRSEGDEPLWEPDTWSGFEQQRKSAGSLRLWLRGEWD